MVKKKTNGKKFLLISENFGEWKVYEIDVYHSVNDALEDFETETGKDPSDTEVFLCDGTEMEVIKGYTLKPWE